jgi:hypothetical protein
MGSEVNAMRSSVDIFMLGIIGPKGLLHKIDAAATETGPSSGIRASSDPRNRPTI